MRYSDNWIKRLLLIAGMVEIILGSAHFAMPHFAYQGKGFSFLNRDETNFVTLCVSAVGILLMAFGVLTIILSKKAEITGEILHYFVITKSFLWSARIVLEILYPVAIPLFFIERPTSLVMPLLIFEWLLFVSSTALITLKTTRVPTSR